MAARKYGNINNALVRQGLREDGWTHVLVLREGPAKGEIFSRHTSEKAAKFQRGRLLLDIIEVSMKLTKEACK